MYAVEIRVVLHWLRKECSFRKFQTYYSSKEMTLLPLITSTNYMIENRVIYLVFWIINECICIGIRKVISAKYLIGSMCYPM